MRAIMRIMARCALQLPIAIQNEQVADLSRLN
jgi:hypothetical protein